MRIEYIFLKTLSPLGIEVILLKQNQQHGRYITEEYIKMSFKNYEN